MSDDKKPEKIELDEVMLAMDVVDTLRHEQQVVDRELASDERDQALFDKLKRMYASQGLPVTDEIIAEGVAALREERFVYRPPAPGGTLWLARLYVNRSRWGKVAAMTAALLVIVLLLYRFAFEAPKARQLVKTAQAINAEITQQQDQLTLAGQRWEDLSRTLTRTKDKTAEDSEAAARRFLSEAELQLSGAGAKLQALEKLPMKADIDGDRLTREGGAIRQRLEQRAALLKEARAHLDKAETALSSLSEIAVLRNKLAGQRQSLLAAIREPSVRRQTEKLYSVALAALNNGDVEGTQRETVTLQNLYTRVTQEYELRITSKPGTPSGVWRQPRNNPEAYNYYIIVDAVAPGGERITVPITSEEDGTTREVSQWGLRVDRSLYEQVRRDKLDDGIIQNNRFGIKESGYLTPQYLMPTTGGAITQW